MEKIISKVTLEFLDGTKIYIDGNDAIEWKRATDTACSYCYANGILFPILNWRQE